MLSVTCSKHRQLGWWPPGRKAGSWAGGLLAGRLAANNAVVLLKHSQRMEEVTNWLHMTSFLSERIGPLMSTIQQLSRELVSASHLV